MITCHEALLVSFNFRPSYVVTLGFSVCKAHHAGLPWACQVTMWPLLLSIHPLLVINQSKGCINDHPFGWIIRSHGAGEAHSQEVLVSVFVLLNDNPLEMGQHHDLRWKSRLNFSQMWKAGKWEAVKSYGPSLRNTPWIISNLWAIMIAVLLSVSLICILHLVQHLLVVWGHTTFSVFIIWPWDKFSFTMVHLHPIGSTQVLFTINLIPTSCAIGSWNLKV